MSSLVDLKEKVQNLKILFVEDEDEIRSSTEIFLKKFFKKVLIATNGEDGLKIFKENMDIDIVLTDIQMPKKNGISMVRDILEIKPNVIVTFISATTLDSMDIENIKYSFIHKPVTYDRIIELLTTVSKKI